MFSHSFVREEHEVLNEKVRCLALLELHSNRVAIRVKLDLDLGRIKLDSALGSAPSTNFLREGKQGRKLLVQVALAYIKRVLSIFVGIALVRMHDGLTKPAIN